MARILQSSLIVNTYVYMLLYYFAIFRAVWSAMASQCIIKRILYSSKTTHLDDGHFRKWSTFSRYYFSAGNLILPHCYLLLMKIGAPSQLCNTNWVAPQTFDLGPLRENWKPLRKTKGIIKAITIFILNCVCERECIWRREIREQNIKIL